MRAKTGKTIAREIERSFKQRKQQIEDSMQNLDPGSRAYLDRLIALANLERKYREERSERGLDPQNLGGAVQTHYHFIATTESAPDRRDAKRRLFDEQMDREYMSGPTDDDEEEPPQPTRKGRKK